MLVQTCKKINGKEKVKMKQKNWKSSGKAEKNSILDMSGVILQLLNLKYTGCFGMTAKKFEFIAQAKKQHISRDRCPFIHYIGPF